MGLGLACLRVPIVVTWFHVVAPWSLIIFLVIFGLVGWLATGRAHRLIRHRNNHTLQTRDDAR